MSFKEKIDLNKLPKHIAIIMDGNGRWAQQQGKERMFGHESAVKAVKEVVEASAEIGVNYLTLYTFSSENWNRPKPEIDALMHLLVSTIHQEVDTLNKNKIRLIVIGDIQSLEKGCQQELTQAIQLTAGNDRMTLILALSYSGRWEITQAVKNIGVDVKENKIETDKIDEKLIASYLNTSSIPDPELLIRTSGEYRISNFLLWQIAYAELYFTQKLWPDFRGEDFYEAIVNYQSRERRFGLTGEQIKGFDKR